MRVPPDQSCTRAAAACEAVSGVARAELRRQPRQPRAECERLDTASRAARRVQVQQQRACVGLHRARDVEDQDELARRVDRLRKARCTGSPPVASEARTSRARRARALSSRVAGGGCAAAAARPRSPGSASGPARTPRASSRRSPSCAGARPRSSAPRLVSPPSSSGPGPGGAALPSLATLRRRLRRGRCGRHRGAEEPASEREVERLDVLAPRDERLPQRPVDVVLPRELDRVEAFQRVRDAARSDLEPDLAQHAAEGDDVADDGVSGHGRLATRPASVSSRTESRSSWYFSTEPSVAWTFSTSSSCRPSAVSACAQSIVSARPGGF